MIYIILLFAFKRIVIVEKASYGGICSLSDQCTIPTVCKNERCTCKQGFVFHDTDCHKSKYFFQNYFIIYNTHSN